MNLILFRPLPDIVGILCAILVLESTTPPGHHRTIM